MNRKKSGDPPSPNSAPTLANKFVAAIKTRPKARVEKPRNADWHWTDSDVVMECDDRGDLSIQVGMHSIKVPQWALRGMANFVDDTWGL